MKKLLYTSCLSILLLSLSKPDPHYHPFLATAVVRVGLGEYQAHILKTDGSMYALGNNSALLGTNNVVSAGVPIACVKSSGSLPAFNSVWGGLHDDAAIDVSGNVWHMGANGNQYLAGIGTTADQPYTTEILTDSSGATFTNVISLAQYFNNTDAIGWVAVKNDGTVWIWGSAMSGFLGNGTDGAVITRPMQVTLPIGKNAIKVIACYSIMVLMDDGTVYSWGGGCNPFGNCLGYACSGSSYKTPHIVDNVTGANDIAGGRNWNWAISPTKVFYCGYPKLNGTGSTSDTPIESFTDITSSTSLQLPFKTIVTNTNATYVVDNTGTLYGTGNSTEGELGGGRTLNPADYNYFIPVNALNLYTTWVTIIPERNDVTKIYGSMPYCYNIYFECNDGQWYVNGRDKGGTIGNGVVSGDYITGGIASSYPNSWDIIYSTPVNCFIEGSASLTPSPYCVLNPSGSPCSDYTIPATHNPTVSAGSNATVNTTTATLTGSATPFSGRNIATYVWRCTAHPGSSYPHFVFPTLNSATGSVSGLVTGVYTFELRATDNLASTNTATVDITVSLGGVITINKKFTIIH